jgi:hypothetical protein
MATIPLHQNQNGNTRIIPVFFEKESLIHYGSFTLTARGGIHTPNPRPLRRDKKKHKTIKHCQFPFINHRKKTLGAMNHPISKRHESAAKKCGPACEQTNHQQ